MKLWSGRFEKTSEKLAEEFNASLPFDIRLYKQDIEGSVAHCKMLAACGIISDSDAEIITDALAKIKSGIESGSIKAEGEDIHSLVENELIKLTGERGKKLHTARSRNDQVATDFRMYLRDSVNTVCNCLKDLITVLADIAEKNVATVMPGYTHLQKAQAVTLGHHFSAYCQMFLRDIQRFNDAYKRINIMPLGSCALASTTYPIDRKMTAALLGFDGITENSMDGVSDRDFALEYLFCCTTVSMHLSRLCEELILWSTEEFSFIEIDDAYATGSSIMPQKKNPDMAELVRGKTGRVYGNLTALLTIMKSLPLAYNKDMQEDKEAVFDSEDTVINCLKIITAMLPSVTFNNKVMKKAAKGGYLNATDAADYLVKKGLPFRAAHEVIGNMVLYCIKHSKTIDALTIEEFKSFSPLFEEDIKIAVSQKSMINGRAVIGGTAYAEVKRQIKAVKKQLKNI